MSSLDKKQFSKLLERAIADRTATEFSNQSGVNRTYISKFLNKRIDNPPSPEILKKIANVAHNNVTYNDLMKTVGFLKEEGRRVDLEKRLLSLEERVTALEGQVLEQSETKISTNNLIESLKNIFKEGWPLPTNTPEQNEAMYKRLAETAKKNDNIETISQI